MDNFELWYRLNCKTASTVVGLSEPLYGIRNYKDTLDLSTGVVTRRIGKVTFDGSGTVKENGRTSDGFRYLVYKYSTIGMTDIINYNELMDEIPYPVYVSDAFLWKRKWIHYQEMYGGEIIAGETPTMFGRNNCVAMSGTSRSISKMKRLMSENPVTIWYILQEPTTETVTVPEGLTGIAEGYLKQNGAPTLDNRIFPEANGEEQPDGGYRISYYQSNMPRNLRVYLEAKYKVRRE